MTLEGGPLSIGVFIVLWFEIAVELVFIRWGVEASDDGTDHRPEVVGLFESTLVYLLGPGGQSVVLVVDEKPMEAKQVLEFVSVQKSSSMVIGKPELNFVFHRKFLESIQVPMILDQGFAFVNVLCEELADSSKSRKIGLPSIWDLALIFSYRTDTISEVLIVLILPKKLTKLGFWDSLTEPVHGSV